MTKPYLALRLAMLRPTLGANRDLEVHLVSEFQPAVPFDSLKQGEIVQRVMAGRALAFYVVDGTPFCTEDMCTHEECFISEGGFVEGDEVECACHGARFSVKTGEVTALPATEPLRTFPVELRDGQVFVSL